MVLTSGLDLFMLICPVQINDTYPSEVEKGTAVIKSNS